MKKKSAFHFKSAVESIATTLSSSRHPKRVLQTLCRKCGPRPPASKGFRAAQQFLHDEWLTLGAREVYQEKVTFDGWQHADAGVSIIKPARRRLQAIQAIHSLPGNVEAQLVDGGRLSADDLWRMGDVIRGAIVLINGHVYTGGVFEHVQKRVSLAEASGAAAVVLAGTCPELPEIQYLSRAKIPVVGISRTDAERLRQLLRRGIVRARVHASGQTRRVDCHNLAGELGPRSRGGEIIMACAHMDTFYLAPAAMDNTSGVVTMTEAARVIAPYQDHFVRTLRFVAFTGEEYGYAGSKAYVRQHAAELDRVKFILSMDCMFEATAEGVAVMWSPPMKNYIARALAGSQPLVDVRNRFCMSSDYLPFMLGGVPAARPADWRNSFPKFTHTIRDTDERVPDRWLKSNAAMCARILLRMLTDPKPLPDRRKTPAEVSELLQRENAGDALRWQVLLPS